MDNPKNISNISINIEATGFTLNDGLRDAINKAVGKLSRFHSRIEYVHVFLEERESKRINQKKLSIRVGIPGNDAFASDDGDDFGALLPSVTEKLRRQLTGK